MTGRDTAERILDAAEALFAQQGYDATSLRQVTTRAGVNLAAVHYHFGSKSGLLRGVVERVTRPANQARLALLQAAMDAAAPRPASLEAILYAFIAPDLRMLVEHGERGAVVARILSRVMSGTSAESRGFIREQYFELGRTFVSALGQALPQVSEAELWWRLHCAVGALTYVLGDPPGLGMLDRDDVEATARRLVAFLAPGMRAPAAPA